MYGRVDDGLGGWWAKNEGGGDGLGLESSYERIQLLRSTEMKFFPTHYIIFLQMLESQVI